MVFQEEGTVRAKSSDLGRKYSSLGNHLIAPPGCSIWAGS